MTRLALRMLRLRPTSVVATLLALGFAVAVVTMWGVMLQSGVLAKGVPQRYAAATVVVARARLSVTDGTGEDRDIESSPLPEGGHVPVSVVSAIAGVPGVRTAIVDDATPSRVVSKGTSEAVQIHPWSAAPLTPFVLRSGSAPVSRDRVVVDQRLATKLGLHPGQRMVLALQGGPRSFTVSGIAAASGRPPQVLTVFATDSQAAAVSRYPGQVGVIGVFAEPGVDVRRLAIAVTKALPRVPADPAGAYLRTYLGADRGNVETATQGSGGEALIAVSSVAGGSTLMIAIIVIAGTVGLSVTERRRDIALLRAVGATPRQVRRMVVRETALLGLIAGAAAIWPGLLGARLLREQFISHGLVSDTFELHVSWLPPFAAVAAAMLVALAAAWIASVRASHIRPTEALGETRVERSGISVFRAALGLVALAGGVTLCIVSTRVSGAAAASMTVPTVFTLVVAVAMFSPLVIRFATMTVGRALRAAGVTGRLAGANTAAASGRLSAVVSSVVLAVALGGSMWFVPTSEQHAAATQAKAGLVADYVITSPSPGLPPSAVAAIQHAEGVVAESGVVRSTILGPQDGVTDYSAQGLDVAGLGHTVDLGVVSGSTSDLVGNSVALDEQTARALHVGIGAEFHGWYGDGVPAVLHVVAIYTRGLGFASLTVPRNTLIGHTASRTDDVIFVATARHTPQTGSAIRGVLHHVAPGASLRTTASYRAALERSSAPGTWTNQLIAASLLVYGIIAAVNALAMYALARRREFAILRLAGTTRRQVLRMVQLEHVLLLGLSLLVGAMVSAATLVPTVNGLTGSLVPYIPVAGWVLVIGGVVLLGGLTMLLPVRRALRMRPVDAIGIRE